PSDAVLENTVGTEWALQARTVCGQNVRRSYRESIGMSKTVEEKTLKCIRCGFCLDACPTFRLTGNEADSPRGRIYLMRSVSENVIPLDASTMGHLDSCLGCRACETACPSGVEYADILEHFRAD